VFRNNKGASVVTFHGLAYKAVEAGLVSKAKKGGGGTYLWQVEGILTRALWRKRTISDISWKTKSWQQKAMVRKMKCRTGHWEWTGAKHNRDLQDIEWLAIEKLPTYRGLSANDTCFEDCVMFWNLRSQILLSAAGTVSTMTSIYHQSLVGSSWWQLVTHCARSLGYLGSRKVRSMGYLRRSGNGAGLGIFRLSMILNDWKKILTCCLKTLLMRKTRPLWYKRSAYFIAWFGGQSIPEQPRRRITIDILWSKITKECLRKIFSGRRIGYL
jgi:hypothetical protein